MPYPRLLLILCISESDVTELKEPLAVLEVAPDSTSGSAPLPEPAFAQDKMVDVATILSTNLRHY